MIDIGWVGFAVLMIALAASTVRDIKNRDKRNSSAIAALKLPSRTSTVIIILVLIVGVLLGGR